MGRRVELISEQEIASRAIFRFIEAHLRHERYDGRMSDELVRVSFERGDSAAALLHDRKSDSVILVEQFRYPTFKRGPGWLLELPAGIITTDEDGKQEVTIRREVLEEVGFEVADLTHMYTFYPSPGASSERLFLYYGATQPTSKVAVGGGNRHEGEDIKTISMPLDDALSKVASGEIVDGKTIIGLQWLKLRLLQTPSSE